MKRRMTFDGRRLHIIATQCTQAEFFQMFVGKLSSVSHMDYRNNDNNTIECTIECEDIEELQNFCRNL